MVAKCANPKCNRQFRHLNKGRLFLLPPSPDSAELIWRTNRLTEYCFWLCPECSGEYTIARVGSALMVSKLEGRGERHFRSYLYCEVSLTLPSPSNAGMSSRRLLVVRLGL